MSQRFLRGSPGRAAWGVLAILLPLAALVGGCTTLDSLEEDEEASECEVNSDCDDGIECNGLEYCSVEDAEFGGPRLCFLRESPCEEGTECDEEFDVCL